MIIFFWAFYIFLSFIISIAVRNLFKNIIFKSLFFSLTLSILISVWFSSPGSENLSPIVSISLLSLISNEELTTLRVLRPFSVVFIFVLLLDLIFTYLKSKNFHF